MALAVLGLAAIGALNAARKISERRADPAAPSASIKDAAHFSGEEIPGPVRAVPYDPAILGGFGGVMFAGLVAVVLGLWVGLLRPSPRPGAGPGPESAGASGP